MQYIGQLQAVRVPIMAVGLFVDYSDAPCMTRARVMHSRQLQAVRARARASVFPSFPPPLPGAAAAAAAAAAKEKQLDLLADLQHVFARHFSHT